MALAPSHRIVLFDLDRTLVRGSSLVHLGRRLAAAGVVRPGAVSRHLAADALFARRGLADGAVTRIRARLLEAVSGLERGPFVAQADAAAAEVAARVFAGARYVLDVHRAAGDECIVLSASPHELVEAVGAALGMDRGIGTKIEHRDGRFTGRLDGPFCYGAGKLARLEEELGCVPLAGSVAYADSRSDEPLLRAAGQAVAVNPDRHLRRTAADEGWPVVRFR